MKLRMESKEKTALGEKLACKVAKHYANVACPFFTFQPKVPKALKKTKNS